MPAMIDWSSCPAVERDPDRVSGAWVFRGTRVPVIHALMAAPGKRSTRTLWLILAVCAAPLVASYTAYYLMPAREPTSYGELLPTRPPPDGGVLADFKGRWVLAVAAPSGCDTHCAATCSTVPIRSRWDSSFIL